MLNKLTFSIGLCVLTSSSFAQTCNVNITESTPISRFTLQDNGTMFDTKTQLFWKRCSEGQLWDGATCSGNASTYTWKAAMDALQALNANGGFAGETDWRVPSTKELDSIVEFKCYAPAINLAVFPGATTSSVWSSTSRTAINEAAWSVNFNLGNVSENSKNEALQIYLVRGGK